MRPEQTPYLSKPVCNNALNPGTLYHYVNQAQNVPGFVRKNEIATIEKIRWHTTLHNGRLFTRFVERKKGEIQPVFMLTTCVIRLIGPNGFPKVKYGPNKGMVIIGKPFK